MPKMTLKEAQEVLEDYWRKVRYMIYSYELASDSKKCSVILEETGNLIDNLLEAAKVVEANRCAEIVNTWFLKTTDEESVRINYVRLINSRNEIMNQILSDNQEGK